MKERPILFSAPMVRAILEGRKSMTRRIVKPRPPSTRRGHPWCSMEDLIAGCKYGIPGDQLWVRETCRAKELNEKEAEKQLEITEEEYPEYGLIDGVLYLADDYFRLIENSIKASEQWLELNCYRGKRGATVSPIHMPRWASRILLEITNVRVERLQEITPEDAEAEGCKKISKDGKLYKYGIPDRDGLPGEDDIGWPWHLWRINPVDAYEALWESINGPGSWGANPWVWVVEFKRVKP